MLLFNCAEKPLTSANVPYFEKKSMHFLKGPICDISKGFIGIKWNGKIVRTHVFSWINSPKMNNCLIPTLLAIFLLTIGCYQILRTWPLNLNGLICFILTTDHTTLLTEKEAERLKKNTPNLHAVCPKLLCLFLALIKCLQPQQAAIFNLKGPQ